MTESIRPNNVQLRYNELELRRHLQARGCPNKIGRRIVEKYSTIQLAAEGELWRSLPAVSVHRPISTIPLISPSPLPLDSLEQMTHLMGIPRSAQQLNRQCITREKAIDPSEKPYARSTSDMDLRRNIVEWQKPEVDKMQNFIEANPLSLFIINTFARGHIASGAVMLPAVNYCLGVIFKNTQGNISAMHMHRAEQPSIRDISGLLSEHENLFGPTSLAGGHLTITGMEFPWEILDDNPEDKIPLLYLSPQLKAFCGERGVTCSRIPVGLDQRQTRVWQIYGTTNITDPIIGKVDISKGNGYAVVPKGYRELMSELKTSYDQEP